MAAIDLYAGSLLGEDQKGGLAELAYSHDAAGDLGVLNVSFQFVVGFRAEARDQVDDSRVDVGGRRVGVVAKRLDARQLLAADANQFGFFRFGWYRFV